MGTKLSRGRPHQGEDIGRSPKGVEAVSPAAVRRRGSRASLTASGGRKCKIPGVTCMLETQREGLCGQSGRRESSRKGPRGTGASLTLGLLAT